jgi:hypothetical protein
MPMHSGSPVSRRFARAALMKSTTPAPQLTHWRFDVHPLTPYPDKGISLTFPFTATS